MTEKLTSLDLLAYLARIRYRGPKAATFNALRALHQAHASHIAFENLDVLAGRPIQLDLASLHAKLVRDERGGYCFEQNTLFAAVLERFGFQVTRLAARVRFRSERLNPRTHMLLRVTIDGAAWLADVGFGGEGLLHPISLEPGVESEQFGWRYRVREEPAGYVLQSHAAGEWNDLYVFTAERQEPVDYVMANHFTATWPDSIFRRMLTVQRATPEARHIVRGDQYLISTPSGTTTRTIAGREELFNLLRNTFAIKPPSGAVLKLESGDIVVP